MQVVTTPATNKGFAKKGLTEFNLADGHHGSIGIYIGLLCCQFPFFAKPKLVACYAMTIEEAQQLLTLLIDKNIQFDKGLTEHEVIQIQQKFDMTFPPDLKSFLQIGLPISKQFPNWRKALVEKDHEEMILEWFEEPLQGILFDIEHNNFWIADWGQIPNTLVQKTFIAIQKMEGVPRLIPIFSHRFISSEPNENDNPVYSVYQTDIIYYGFNLPTYLSNEFNFQLPENFNKIEQPKLTIKFWSDIAS